MSIWNPEKGDPWYEEPEEDVPVWTWQKVVIDTLILLIVVAFVAFISFTLGYFNVYKT